jgi:hypothetical protein
MKLAALVCNQVVTFLVQLLDFLGLGLQLLLQIGRNQLGPIVLLVLLFLMELEILLNHVLNELFSETLYQVELVLENHHTKEHLPVLELPLTKLELSHLSHLFHHLLNLSLQLLVKTYQLQSPVHWVRAFGFGRLLLLLLVLRVYHIVDLNHFISSCNLRPVSLVVDDNFFAIYQRQTECLVLRKMVFFLVILFAQHSLFPFNFYQ